MFTFVRAENKSARILELFDFRNGKASAVNHQEMIYGKRIGVSEVIRTPDLPLRSMVCCFVWFSSNNFLSEIRACVMMYMTKMT